MTDTTAPRSTDGELIRTTSQPNCYLCGRPGNLLYAEMHDRLFGVSGEWTLRQCATAECGLVWLDPCPITEDIPKLYRNYYTHQSSGGIVMRVYRWLCQGVLAATLGYQARGRVNHLVGRLLSRTGVFRDGLQSSVLWLPASGGRLLDVGCGSGDFPARMRDLGWEAEGLEPDPAAAAVARQRGIPVTAGLLDEGTFPPGSFDVITMSHVLEHLPDPIATLRACRRSLKPGGRVVAITPNANALGTRVFGRNWLAYDPPRHLMLATTHSLKEMAIRAGFSTAHVRTSARLAWMTWRVSEPLLTRFSLPGVQLPLPITRIPIGMMYHLREHSANVHRPVGEELVLMAHCHPNVS